MSSVFQAVSELFPHVPSVRTQVALAFAYGLITRDEFRAMVVMMKGGCQ